MAGEDRVELYDERFPKLTSREVGIIQEIEKVISTEEEAARYIEQLARSEELIKCSKCGSNNVSRDEGSRQAICKICNAKTWFTKDTYFKGIRKLRTALLALLFRVKGVFLTAADLQKLCNIANSTAQLHLKRAELVQLEEQRASSGVRVCTSAFLACIGRRSSETPARKHPKFEQFELDASRSEQMVRSVEQMEEGTEPDDDSSRILRALKDKRLTLDALCVVTEMSIPKLSGIVVQLELDGKVKRLLGDRYECIAKSISFFADPSQVAEHVEDSICAYCQLVIARLQFVSRKNIELNSVAYWRFLQPGDESALRKFIARQVTGRDVRQFVSSPFVNMPTLAA